MKLRTNIDFFDNRFMMFILDNMANELDNNYNKNVIRMTLGKSELPLHPEIINTFEKAIKDFKKSSLVYPGGLPELKERLSIHYSEQYGVEISPKNFVISTGTSTLFRNLFYLLSKKGDEVLIPIPYYSLYKFSALLSEANIKYYKINLSDQRLDIKSFKENFTEKTKIVVINTPGNPLGNILSDEELYEIDNIVNGNAVIINDEIYSNTYFDEDNKSVMRLKNTKSTFITTNAFSKAYRMYSRRVGYCIVPDELVEPLTVIQHHTLLTVDPVVQFAALTSLDYPDEVKKLVSLYRERRDYTIERFKNVELVDTIHSKGGFYITLDCKKFMDKYNFKSSFDLAKKIIETKYVATVPGSDFGLPYTLRLSFSTSRYNEGIDLLVDFFSKEYNITEINYGSLNNTKVCNRENITLSEIIAEQCNLTPNSIAVIDYDRTLTYSELEEKSNQVADILIKKGVEAGQTIGVVLDRSIELVISAIAILKCGCTYVPIDSSYPENRIQYILNDSLCKIVICQPDKFEFFKDLDNSHLSILYTDKLFEINKNCQINFKSKLNKVDDNSIAYIIYTSGTTGFPKGVMVSHKAVLNTLFWSRKKFNINFSDTIALKTSISFTDSIWELFSPLISGAKISIANNSTAKDPKALYDWIKNNQITIMQFVPTMLKVLLDYIENNKIVNPLPYLNWILNGGEHVTMNLAQRFNRIFYKARIANTYGMTESAIYATCYIIEKYFDTNLDSIPIGRPIDNTNVYILNSDNELCNINEKGEICISGKGLASGYWRNPDITASKFITGKNSLEVIYKTGDIGAVSSDGDIRYYGRIDNQVKIRGYKVEITEVEKNILQYEGINDVAVIAKKDKFDDNVLICYLTNRQIDIELLKNHLNKFLPTYMIPQKFLFIDKLPLTINNKIDRNKLYSLESKISKQTIITSEDTITNKLINIWSELLNDISFGLDDDFFDLGGSSILIARMQLHLEKSDIHVSNEDLYKFNTINKLANYLKDYSCK